MLSKIKISGCLVAALLVTCLLSWPSPANASGGGAWFNGEEQEEAKSATLEPPQATVPPAQQKNASDLKKEGIELYHSGNYSQAIETFKQMEGRTQDKSLLAQAYIYLSMSYYCLEEQEESKKWLKKAVEINPEINEADLLFPPGFDKLYYETKSATPKSPQTKAVTPDKAQVADAASGTGGTKKKSSALSLKLYGGLSYLSAGDANTGAGGYFDFYRLLAEVGGFTATGDYSPVHAGYDFGADLIFQLSPHFGVGIGVGYLRSAKTSVLGLSTEVDEVTVTGTPTLSAMPIRLGLFFSAPLGGKLSFAANAGAAYYASLKFDSRLRIETEDYWGIQEISGGRSNLSNNLGFQGGLGLEYKMSPKMGLFVELLGRSASFKNFDTVTASSEDSDGVTDTTEGKIYLEKNVVTEGTWTWFVVEEAPPVSVPPNLVYTEPKFDFSGFCLHVGMRIRF